MAVHVSEWKGESMTERRERWECYEILNDGKCPLGKKHVVRQTVGGLHEITAEEAAEALGGRLMIPIDGEPVDLDHRWIAVDHGEERGECRFQAFRVHVEVLVDTAASRRGMFTREQIANGKVTA